MKRFRKLIDAMPEQEQAFTSRKRTWEKYLAADTRTSQELKSLFGDEGELEISRNDLFGYSAEGDLTRFIIATLLWGYPSGMRGNHFLNITNEINNLTGVLAEAKLGVTDWETHYSKIKAIHGLGLSTYTKFLYFLGITICGHPALILDDRIIRTINKGVFIDFQPLQKISSYNAVRNYPYYLEVMDQIAQDLGVDHGRLEMFVFEFGLNIKTKKA